ncbi:MAG TPA: OmpH family outer membrane protein [Chryseolinea sp.]|nr:OmpH family outer membrane protein [Chryseolinea sp.]
MRWSFTLFLVITMVYCQGQTAIESQKIGHADWDYIFSKLPEYKKIETELKTFETQLQNQIRTKSQELETKFRAYQSLPADTPEAIKKDKESELAYLQENIQKFQQDAQASMQKKQTDLLIPYSQKWERLSRRWLMKTGTRIS